MAYYRIRACVRRVSSGTEVITRDEFPKKESVLTAIDSLLDLVKDKSSDLEIVRITLRESN